MMKHTKNKTEMLSMTHIKYKHHSGQLLYGFIALNKMFP